MKKTPEYYRQMSMGYANGILGRKPYEKLEKPAWNYVKSEAEK